jgi:hypothetical protein
LMQLLHQCSFAPLKSTAVLVPFIKPLIIFYEKNDLTVHRRHFDRPGIL